jgi:hypothetical protein
VRGRISHNHSVAYAAVLQFAVALAIAVPAAPARADVALSSEISLSAGSSGRSSDPSVAGEHAAIAPPPSPDALEERVQAGRHWRLDTPRGAIHVWVPAGYDASTAATVVFVHGYWTRVDDAWQSYRLAQQFALSGINALFIAPEAPAAKWRPIVWPSLGELVRTVAGQVDVAVPTTRLVAVGHSGAYRTLAVWLADPALDTVVLLDAVYAEYGLLPWVRMSDQHRLVNVVYETGRFSGDLHGRLPSTLRVDGLPLGGLPEARILYVRTDVGHWELVTGGVALPLALRAIDVASVRGAPLSLPLGLPLRFGPAVPEWRARGPFPVRNTDIPY